ncbi:MAG: phage late control D family protein [Spirochaetales bacterium]|nr:phage late control D family protein [Spirochaetales bacterium]
MAGDNDVFPVFIIYFNGARLPVEREAEIKEITILNRLDAPSSFSIVVADQESEWAENDDFYVGAEVEIMLGYLNDPKPFITGEVTGMDCNFKQDRVREVVVRGFDRLHRLNRCKKSRSFSQMTAQEIIEQIAGDQGLKTDVESLPHNHLFTLQHRKTDYEYLIDISDFYDTNFWVDDKTLYVKRLERNKAEDIVLEYEKTLIEFLPQTDTSGIVSEVEIRTWDDQKQEVLVGSAVFGDIDSPGGEVVDSNFGGAKALIIEPLSLDQKNTDQRSMDILVRNNREYVTGYGETYGNADIRAGSIVKAEGLGKKFSGKYFIVAAKHAVKPLSGYTTSFAFTSGLGSPSRTGGEDAGMEGHPVGSTKKKEEEAVAAAAGEEKQEKETQKKPQISNCRWLEDGNQIGKAHVKDKVTLAADVTDIDDGVWVEATIWEKDEVGSDDFIGRKSAQVKGSKIEVQWEVEYHEDRDDVESAEEEKEKGYTLPEYVFTITSKKPEAESGESPVLEVYDIFEYKPGSHLNGRKVKLILADGSEREVTITDNKISEKELPIGPVEIIYLPEGM